MPNLSIDMVINGPSTGPIDAVIAKLSQLVDGFRSAFRGGDITDVGEKIGQSFAGSLGPIGQVASALGPVGIAATAATVGLVGFEVAATKAAMAWESMSTGIGRTTGLDGKNLEGLMNVAGEAGPELILPLSDRKRTAELLNRYLPVRKFAQGGVIGMVAGAIGTAGTPAPISIHNTVNGSGLSESQLARALKEASADGARRVAREYYETMKRLYG